MTGERYSFDDEFRRVLYESIARNTGIPPQQFIDMPLDEKRKYMEKRSGQKMNLVFLGIDRTH